MARVLIGVLVLSLAVTTVASAGVVRQITDVKATSYDWPVIVGDGSEVLVITSSDQFGGDNPSHIYRIASFDPTTGAGTVLSSFSSSLGHMAERSRFDVPDRQNLSVSDDGQWLAFISDADLIPGQNGNRSAELFVMMRDGTQLAQLTDDSTPNAGAVSFVAMAGSGNRIAFISTSDLLGSNPGLHEQLYLIDVDGMNLTQMTGATGGAFDHMWISDDGTRMAFSHDGDLVSGGNPEGNIEVFTIARGDTTPRQVTSTVTGDSAAATISGDGSRIAFHSDAILDGQNHDGLPEIYHADWATATVERGTNGASESTQPWLTDDGVWVFYTYVIYPNATIYKKNLDAKGQAGQPSPVGAGGVNAMHPVVSEDGSQVAFWTDDGLYTTDDVGSNVLQLIDRVLPASEYWPGISADGQWLVFTRDYEPLGTGNGLFTQRADGTGLTELLAGCGICDRPAISGDGSRIYIESKLDWNGENPWTDYVIWGMDRDGTNMDPHHVCPGGTSLVPDVADDDSTVVSASFCTGGPGWFGEVFRADPDGGNPTQLTFGYGLNTPRVDGTGDWVVGHSRDDVAGGNPDEGDEVWRISTDGLTQEQLTSDPVYRSLLPDISGDGSRIVYMSDADFTGQNADHNTEIFLYEPATMATTQLTMTATGANTGPRLSRDGAYVYFFSDFRHLGGAPADGRFWLYRIHIDTRTLERAGGLGSEDVTFFLEVDGTGDRVLFISVGDPTGENPDGYREIFLVDYTALNPIVPSAGPAPTTVSWKPEPGMLRYDVIRGDVANLQHSGGNVDLGSVVCLENDSGDTNTVGFEDTAEPAPGQAFFYLFRGSMGVLAGAGSYDEGSGGLERVSSAGDCSL